MGLLHFHFSFFLGGPDGPQERFSMILVALWEPLGPSWGLLGLSWGLLGLSWGHLEAILDVFKRITAKC